jgi:two-component system NtrC family response regulator
MLLAKHLPDEIRIKAIQATMKDEGTSCRERENGEGGSCLPQFKDYKENVLRQAEKEYLLELLASTRGSIKQACRISGLGRTWLYALMKKHGINKSAYVYQQMESLPSGNSAELFGPLN